MPSCQTHDKMQPLTKRNVTRTMAEKHHDYCLINISVSKRDIFADSKRTGKLPPADQRSREKCPMIPSGVST